MDLGSPTQDQRFDLITIAQALHWFEFDKLLKLTQGLLTPDGKLFVLGYYALGIDYNMEDV